MSEIYLKDRSLKYLRYWIRKIDDAENNVECCNNTLLSNKVTLSDEHILKFIREKEKSQRLIDEYNTFMNQLTEVEKQVLIAYAYDKEKPFNMDYNCYENIKSKVFKKWCIKDMPHNIVYIHKIDISKLGSILKKARINKDYKGSAIADFLDLAACTFRNF